MTSRRTPADYLSRMPTVDPSAPERRSAPRDPARHLPPHLASWQLPPGWRWGRESVEGEYRHYQEIIDALGRSLSLVSAPDPAHAEWVGAEARVLAHRTHPAVPTTYHYWAPHRDSRRGPGYLRRWISGETVAARQRRVGADDVPAALRLLRATGAALSYLHDTGSVLGALSGETVWSAPTGRLWLLGWEWTVERAALPPGVRPSRRVSPAPPEWGEGEWDPTPASDQWQLAAMLFGLLAGEPPPRTDVPPIEWVRPDTPRGAAEALDRALSVHPGDRFPTVAALLRALDRSAPSRVSTGAILLQQDEAALPAPDGEEARLRWAVGDDYEVLSSLGAGTFGSVWRVRDLALEREVALKMLHPRVAQHPATLARFRREARLAAQLAHPAIVPIYDWDERNGVAWYTMELAENGSVADLIARTGPRELNEVAPQVELVLDALAAAHATAIIHRDLKPENLLLDRYHRWRIADFGIANVTGEDVSGPTGTPAFASPEQLLGEGEQGPAVDCFAMAAIVAFVLTGAAPFGTGDHRTILARELSGQADLYGVQPAVAAWLRRGLNPEPEARFVDAAEMLDQWRRTLALTRGGAAGAWWRRLTGRR